MGQDGVWGWVGIVCLAGMGQGCPGWCVYRSVVGSFRVDIRKGRFPMWSQLVSAE